MTIKEVLKHGALLSGISDNALLNCEVLLAYALGVEREDLIKNSDQLVDENLFKVFESYCERVKKGEPVAYITNSKEFYGLDFFVDNRVLVPRPETEMIVEAALGYLDALDRDGKRVLDVGTGSGCIAIAIASNIDREFDPGASVDAVDISEDALGVARLNVDQHGVGDLVHIFQSDLLEFAEEGESYDVITANLPYIGEVKHAHVDENVREHEPDSALFAGDDGLSLYERLFQEVEQKGINFGMMIGEFGFAQSEDLAKLLKKHFGDSWRIEKDLAGIERVFIIENHVG